MFGAGAALLSKGEGGEVCSGKKRKVIYMPSEKVVTRGRTSPSPAGSAPRRMTMLFKGKNQKINNPPKKNPPNNNPNPLWKRYVSAKEEKVQNVHIRKGKLNQSNKWGQLSLG